MKSNNLSKYLNIFIAIIAVVGAVLFIRIFTADADAIINDPETQDSIISPIISFSTLLLYASIAIAVLVSIWTLVKNPDNLKKTLLGLLVLGVILVVAYFTADSEEVVGAKGVLLGGEAGSSTNHWVSTGIWYSLFLGAIAGAFFVYDLFKGLIKS